MSIISPLITKPIPQELPTVAGWKLHPIKENNEKLVPLGAFSKYSKTKIISQAIYYGETPHSPYHYGELDGAMITPFVREGVAEKLVKASEMLPDNMFLLVLDAYRPLSVQKALYDDFYGQLIKSGLSHEQAEVEAQKFVSMPSNDPTKPSPHNTGGSVDLTIIKVDDETAEEIKMLNNVIAYYGEDETMWETVYKAELQKVALLRNKGKELPMGTDFDEVCPATATSFFEKPENADLNKDNIKENRRLLFNCMIAAGFTNYDEEWWHFDSGNQFDAIKTGKPAIYSNATPDEEGQAHEKMMQDHYKGLAKLTSGESKPECAVGLFVQETGKLVETKIGHWNNSPLAAKAKRLTVTKP